MSALIRSTYDLENYIDFHLLVCSKFRILQKSSKMSPINILKNNIHESGNHECSLAVEYAISN